MSRRPVIAIIGSGSASEPALSNTHELGRLIAENGWVLITGGRDAGVMNAANEGAKAAKDSLTIGILPNRQTNASPFVDVAIITDAGEGRNNMIVLSADVVIACGVDDAGTASEVALAIKNEKYVILLGANDEARAFFRRVSETGVTTVESAKDAIAVAASLLDGRPRVQISSHE
jgi:uncharacterized protein (TIGR00725 family)